MPRAPRRRRARFVYHLINRGNARATHLILRLVPIVPAVQSLTAVQEFKGSKVQGERTPLDRKVSRLETGGKKSIRIALDLLIGYAPASERAGSRIGSALSTSRGRGKQATNLSSLRLP